MDTEVLYGSLCFLSQEYLQNLFELSQGNETLNYRIIKKKKSRRTLVIECGKKGETCMGNTACLKGSPWHLVEQSDLKARSQWTPTER